MKLTIVNRSRTRVPRRFLEAWVERLERELARENRKRAVRAAFSLRPGQELGLVFLDTREARALNRTYRKKDYATDVLSFEGDEIHMLGELVLCPQVLKRQAAEHGLRYREELGYMIVHGMLHLLGFEHERGGRAAREMYALQDRIFEVLCGPPEAVTPKSRPSSPARVRRATRAGRSSRK
ncbi:MAG: rRNA maturation RNase YbeY [Bdellovibrionaceae bacterium]|nr:rRNA maturation RNase YbeY [Pseudobdellovibrionaceae bacterium]